MENRTQSKMRHQITRMRQSQKMKWTLNKKYCSYLYFGEVYHMEYWRSY